MQEMGGKKGSHYNPSKYTVIILKGGEKEGESGKPWGSRRRGREKKGCSINLMYRIFIVSGSASVKGRERRGGEAAEKQVSGEEQKKKRKDILTPA